MPEARTRRAGTLAVSVVEAGAGRGLPGVAVTTGEAISKTGPDGSCTLPVEDDHRFVWLTRPAGWRAAGDFYRALPASGQVRFELTQDPRPRAGDEAVRLVQVTDTHVVGEGELVSGADLAAALAQLADEAAPDLVVASGDLTNLGSPDELVELRRGLAALGDTPLLPLFGGHDGNAERRAGDREPPWTLNWEACFGPTYYSLDRAGRHIVIWPNEEGFFSAADRRRKRRWLEADLALHRGAGPTLLVTHAPPPAGFVDDMAERGVDLILHGHWHSVKVHRRAKVFVAAAPPLCFGGIDTSPRGYRVVEWRLGAPAAQTRVAALGAGRLRRTTPSSAGGIRLAWERDLAADGLATGVHRAAPVAAHGHIAVSGSTATGGALHCLSAATGADLWAAQLGAPVRNAVRIAGGRILALEMTGALNALDLDDGRLAWRRELPGHPDRWLFTSPVAADGVVYAGGKAGLGAFALDTGESLWYTPLEGDDSWSCYASPALAGDLVVLLVARRGIVALARQDGAVAWEQQLDLEYLYAAPVLLGGDLAGDLVTGGARRHLARLVAATGRIIWHGDVLDAAYPAGLAADDQRLYAVTPAGAVQAHDPQSGACLWRAALGQDLLDMTPYERGIRSGLAAPVRLGPYLLAGGNDGVLRLLDPATGAEQARADFGAPLTAPPCPLAADAFCAVTWDGRLCRYG